MVVLCEAADRVHMGVGQLFRPNVGVELTADFRELFAGVEDLVDLAVAEKVLHRVWYSCRTRDRR